MFCVVDRTAATLLPIIEAHIRPGTIIVSDQWRTYNRVGHIVGYHHLTVNH
uniref:ISXO2-like transposase domain-containing protein n=1 Tax=Arion vulgaris TaxID=1028688 RepID=A0A0B6Z0A2_9EUPU